MENKFVNINFNINSQEYSIKLILKGKKLLKI